MSKRRIDTSPYTASHWSAPTGFGLWIFQNADTGDERELTGEYREVLSQLPTGTWKVLP